MSIEQFGVYVLTMRDATRMASIERQLCPLGIAFQYIDATVLNDLEDAGLPIDAAAIQQRRGRMLTKGEVSCFLSHRRIWQQVVDAGTPGVILEDDALIERDLPLFLERLADANPSFDVVLLGHAKKDHRHKTLYHFLEPLKLWEPVGPFKLGRGFKTWTSGAVGYVVTPAGAANLLEASHSIRSVLDDWPLFESLGLEVKEVRPLLVWEDFVNIASSLEGDRQTPARNNFFFVARWLRGGIRHLRSRLSH
ncbi:glycosyltransferase family 25 protein [Vreelandella stevensii]|uniref:glycosyltransferase family 25 protein n=1 Tax=Vreelandella stevensii TaxID=502821 RepID=UPI00403AA95A